MKKSIAWVIAVGLPTVAFAEQYGIVVIAIYTAIIAVFIAVTALLSWAVVTIQE